MTDIQTTDIQNLPTNPSMDNGQMQPPPQQMMHSQQGQGQGQSLALDQNTISQIVNGLQQASMVGATSLPSRDIPMNQEQDAQSRPNYVPQPTQKYIEEEPNDYEYPYKQQQQQQQTADVIYDEIHMPLLIAILYFLFQLPVFKNKVFCFFPYLCHTDGNYNINGLFCSCALFGGVYYVLNKYFRNK